MERGHELRCTVFDADSNALPGVVGAIQIPAEPEGPVITSARSVDLSEALLLLVARAAVTLLPTSKDGENAA